MNFIPFIAKNLQIREKQVENTLKLLLEGATVPFISRYRKEATEQLDEVQIAEIKTQHDKYTELEKRKTTILNTIEEQGKLTSALQERIATCWDSNEIEDIYLPYKPKRRTRAEMARQKGLEGLANKLQLQTHQDLESLTLPFVKQGVASIEEALKGARDIIAERISEHERNRQQLRYLFQRTALIQSKTVKGKEEEAAKYRDYFSFSKPLKRCSSHQILAIRRAEKEGFLKSSIVVDEEEALAPIKQKIIKGNQATSLQVNEALKDAYKRLLHPAIATEFAALSKEKADDEAIQVFTANLKQLLLAPPLGQKRVLAIDPGFRTGCKIVCLDAQGKLLHNEAIYPHPPKNDKKLAAKKITKLVEAYKIEAIAIGNGTASRETERFITTLRFDRDLQVFVVSEDGASIYSASAVAREEFPSYDVTVRGAVSIGRRLMDPLAELVKIDPKSLGVGQYQHDVDSKKLKEALDQTVISCVNAVGVNLNTASKHLLSYVSGLGPQLAQNIVDYRSEHGPFKNRHALLEVPRMGQKSFEQCAGFLRLPQGEHPLDNTAVHPERYSLVEQMAKDLNCNLQDLITSPEKQQKIDKKNYCKGEIGLPTLEDILLELSKPGRDPREKIKIFSFDETIRSIEDLKIGMTLPGIVTNVTNFGCFVNIGIKENGLVHISQLSEGYISDPTSIVSVHQQVQVKVLEIDLQRKRIQLTMKGI